MCCSENEPLVDENPATPPTSFLFSAFMKVDNKFIANVNQDDPMNQVIVIMKRFSFLDYEMEMEMMTIDSDTDHDRQEGDGA